MISPVNFALIIGGIGTFAVLIFCFCSPYSPQKCKGESSHTLCSCFMICLIKPSENRILVCCWVPNINMLNQEAHNLTETGKSTAEMNVGVRCCIHCHQQYLTENERTQNIDWVQRKPSSSKRNNIKWSIWNSSIFLMCSSLSSWCREHSSSQVPTWAFKQSDKLLLVLSTS